MLYKGCPLKFKKLPLLIWTHSRTMREKMVEDNFALQHQLANMNFGGDFLGRPLHLVWGRGNIGRPCDFLRWRGRVLWSGSRVLHPVNYIYFTSNNSTPYLILYSVELYILCVAREATNITQEFIQVKVSLMSQLSMSCPPMSLNNQLIRVEDGFSCWIYHIKICCWRFKRWDCLSV